MTPADFVEKYRVSFDWEDNGGFIDKGFQYLITIKVGHMLKYTTTYSMGIGHWKDPDFPRGAKDKSNAAQHALGVALAGHNRELYLGRSRPVPNMLDFLHCLLMDSGAHGQPFAEWCMESGLNPDSIKAKAIYDACMHTGMQFLRMFGHQGMIDLQDAFMDY